MHASDDTPPEQLRKAKTAHPQRPPNRVHYAKPRRPMRFAGCLVWLMAAMISLSLAGMAVIGSAVAGWNSGIGIARDNATQTVAADLQQQCQHVQTNMDEGRLPLVQTRLEYLQTQTPAPACLSQLVPRATAFYLTSLPTATPMPTLTPPTIATVTATREPATATASGNEYDYDMDALLAEAEADLRQQNYQAAIETLDAVIAIDADFQRDYVRSQYFTALTAQANLLFRTGKLAEGIVTATRAENYGDIGELGYERFIAQLYLDAQRLKTINPAESVRLLSRIVYEQGLSGYLNGLVIADLQEAYRNYGDALSGQGDHCRAEGQYTAALDLRPALSKMSLGTLAAQRDSAAQACSGAPTAHPSAAASPDAGEPSAPPIRPTLVPVGQTG